MSTERRWNVNSALHYPLFSNCMRQNYPRADDNSFVAQEIVENVTCKKKKTERELQYDVYFNKHNVRVVIEVD